MRQIWLTLCCTILFIQISFGQVKSGPYIQQGGMYEGKSSIEGNQQTCSCTISADGNTAIIGAFNKGAYILVKSQNRWIQEAEILSSEDIQKSHISSGTAISKDGNTIAIGGIYDNTFTGATWIFRRVNSKWEEEVKLVGTGGEIPSFQGNSLAFSSDGLTLAVGAYADNAVFSYTKKQIRISTFGFPRQPKNE